MTTHIRLFFALFFFPCALFAADVQIVNLKVEYTETPIGIDIQNPRFSWQMSSEKPGYYQTAYQIIVTDESSREVWNSGKKNSDISLNIKYAGIQLKPATHYRWKLIVWDQNN